MPMVAIAQAASQGAAPWSVRNPGKWVPMNWTWKPQTKKPATSSQ